MTEHIITLMMNYYYFIFQMHHMLMFGLMFVLGIFVGKFIGVKK